MRKLKFRMWKYEDCEFFKKGMYGDDQAKSSAWLTVGSYRFRKSECDVMQYINKNDCNNVEIYEGDIVKVEYIYNEETIVEQTEVCWDEESCSYSPFNWEYDCDGCECSLEILFIEVVGNKYEGLIGENV